MRVGCKGAGRGDTPASNWPLNANAIRRETSIMSAHVDREIITARERHRAGARASAPRLCSRTYVQSYARLAITHGEDLYRVRECA